MSGSFPHVVCTVEAKMGSVRLPGKALLPVGSIPMLKLMLTRLSGSMLIDQIVVVTTTTTDDWQIVDLVNSTGVHTCFRGGENRDVLLDVLKAARGVNADIIVETTGDCPLICPAVVDAVVANYLLGGADFVTNTLDAVKHGPTTPRGMDVRVFSVDALAEISERTSDPIDRINVSTYFWEHPDEYTVREVWFDLPEWVRNLRLCVDYEEDYEFVNGIAGRIDPLQLYSGRLSDIIAVLEQHPELCEINAHIEQEAYR